MGLFETVLRYCFGVGLLLSAGDRSSSGRVNPNQGRRYQWPFEIANPRVQEALATVPREIFVRANDTKSAGENCALPIECGQTISQPYVVSLMTEKLQIRPDSRILEIGTGSGYQCAILAELAAQVFTIEVIPELAHAARGRLQALGYQNIEYRMGDGAAGWAEAGPFDGILVTCAATDLPLALWEQLVCPGGRLVIPIGDEPHNQELRLYQKHYKQAPNSPTVANPIGEIICPVRFVPMTSG